MKLEKIRLFVIR